MSDMPPHTTNQHRRQLAIVSQLRHTTATSKQLARKLNCSTKTIQRDIRSMQARLDAPITYDEAEHGYRLTDAHWTYPTHELEGDYLFASLFAFRLSEPHLPPALHDLTDTITRVQLAADDPARLPPQLDHQLLAALIPATSAQASPSPDTFHTILDAWRDAHRLSLTYTNRHGQTTTRELDPQALFLHASAWYIYGYCHSRRSYRRFAIHRCHEVQRLSHSFERDPHAIANLNGPNPFGYELVGDITIDCAPAMAQVIGERQWFPGQAIQRHPEGGLTLSFPQAPRPTLIHWVLAYAPHLTVQAPEELRREIHEIAKQLAERHT